METIFWFGVASLACFIPWLLTVYIRKQVIPTTRTFWLSLLVAPWFLLLTILVFDPGRYIIWFLD